jgi:hypothetical protein
MCAEYFLIDPGCPSIPSLFGSNVTRNCIELCNWGEYADPTSRQCTRICPTGSYGDDSTRKCVTTCPSSQQTFADPLTHLCVKYCPADYYGDTNTRYCVPGIDCSNNTYGDPVTQICVEAQRNPLAIQYVLWACLWMPTKDYAYCDVPPGATPRPASVRQIVPSITLRTPPRISAYRPVPSTRPPSAIGTPGPAWDSVPWGIWPILPLFSAWRLAPWTSSRTRQCGSAWRTARKTRPASSTSTG